MFLEHLALLCVAMSCLSILQLIYRTSEIGFTKIYFEIRFILKRYRVLKVEKLSEFWCEIL